MQSINSAQSRAVAPDPMCVVCFRKALLTSQSLLMFFFFCRSPAELCITSGGKAFDIVIGTAVKAKRRLVCFLWVYSTLTEDKTGKSICYSLA